MLTPTKFDPYHLWLGIHPSEQPADDYRLLGLVWGEDDPGVIQGAADRQIAHVRSFQCGPRAAESQRLLNELSGACHRLLNAKPPDPVDDYYFDPLYVYEPECPPTPEPEPEPEPPPLPPPVQEQPVEQPRRRVRIRRQLPSQNPAVVAVGIILGGAAGIILGAALMSALGFDLF